MVEWSRDRYGGFESVIFGMEKWVWSRCKATLQLFDLNWQYKDFEYGGWLHGVTFGKVGIGAIVIEFLFYGPRDGVTFYGRIHLNVLMDTIGIDHSPIWMNISFKHQDDSTS